MIKSKELRFIEAFFVFIFCLHHCFSQQLNDSTNLSVLISKNTIVGKENANAQLIEPHLASHPSNPNKLIAVGWVFPSTGESSKRDVEKCAVFTSNDAGKTWDKRYLSGESCADPWLVFTENEAVLSTLSYHPLLNELPNSKESEYQLLLYNSIDEGKTWSAVPQSLGIGHDGPRLVSSADGNIYLASHQFRNNKKGKPRFPIYLASAKSGIPFFEKTNRYYASNLNLAMDGITTTSNGTLVITYQDFQRPVNGFKNRGREGVLKTRRQWATTSNDKGKTFSAPKLITESCYDRANNIVTDTSNGAYNNRIYCLCSGDKWKSILLMHSDDGAEEWTSASPIEAANSAEGIRSEPQIAVNNKGVLGVAWLDNKDETSGNCFAPYVAFSSNGGKSFTKAYRVGDALSCPDIEAAGKFVVNRWPEGGDYFGFTTTADGRFHIVWPDARTGKFDLMHSYVEVSPIKE